MATFALMITAPPYAAQGALSALHFARAAIAGGHQIHSVFFSGEAVAIGNRCLQIVSDEINLSEQWRVLSQEHRFELQLCSSAAVKAGVLDEHEAARAGLPATLASGFIIAGLGSWVEASLVAERNVHFAGH